MNKKDFLKKLSEVPQKYEDFGTITYQMKLDIFDNFNGKDYNYVEMGCYKGYTIDILSGIFKNVLGLEHNDECLNYAKNNNINNKNVLFEKIDLYNQPEWDNIFSKYKDKYEVALIDASHSYKSCKTDIINAIKLGCKHIIVDDVGVYDDIKQALSEIQEEYSDVIDKVYPIGIDWKHYRLPILNVPVYCLRMNEINVGYSGYEFNWILRDKTDIDINKGDTNRPMYNPININLQVVRNYAEFVSGHVVNDVKSNNPDLVVNLNNCSIPFLQRGFYNLDMSTTDSSPKPSHKFVPFPVHRFKPNEIQSFFSDEDIFDEDDTNYEGIIIELKGKNK
jgi:hypothetical protein